MVELGPLNRVLSHVRTRLRVQGMLEGLTVAAVAAGVSLAVGVLASRLGHAWLAPAAWASLGGLALGALAGALWPVPLARAASRVDVTHGLKSRVRSALEFATGSEATPFMQAALRDAAAQASRLSPRKAAPFKQPRALPALLPAAGLSALAAWFPLSEPASREPDGASVRPVAAVQLDADALDAFRQDLARVTAQPEPGTEASQYGELLDALERGDLTRAQALDALDDLRRRLATAGTAYSRVVREGLARVARGLGDGRVTSELVQALTGGDPEAAAEALEELSRRLSRGELSERERETLREALERAARARGDDDTMAEPELLKQEHERPSDPEPSLLRDPEEEKRQLEELRREREARERAKRQLEELRRELGSAGGAAGQTGSQNLDRAAQDLRDMAQDGLSEQQRRKLAEQIEQLRQQLQRQSDGQEQPQPQQQQQGQTGGAGESQQQRLERFRLQAGGGEGQSSMPIVAPPKPSDEHDGGQGDAGAGQAEGDAGADGGPQRQQVLQLGGEGQANASLEMPGLGGQEQVSERRPSDESPRSTGRPDARLDGRVEDSQVAGVASPGPSRSQVILGAADQGFASAPYEKVYGEYRSHAESVLERDQIPPGYRFYVRRYFQLIRPREGSQNP